MELASYADSQRDEDRSSQASRAQDPARKVQLRHEERARRSDARLRYRSSLERSVEHPQQRSTVVAIAEAVQP